MKQRVLWLCNGENPNCSKTHCALLRPEILKPKAYALYKIWREVERSEVPKVRKRQDKGE